MNIWEIDKFFLFFIFFIPGFISIKVYDLLIPSERRDFSKSLFELIGYSSLNYAALSWLIIIIHSGEFYTIHKLWYFISFFLIMFIMPVLWPIIILKLSKLKPISKYILHPIKKPWDYVFNEREAAWVIVHLKDGRKIGGIYGENSFASSFPYKEEIYLEKLWNLNDQDKFMKPINRSKGAIILNDEILAIEFFE